MTKIKMYSKKLGQVISIKATTGETVKEAKKRGWMKSGWSKNRGGVGW